MLLDEDRGGLNEGINLPCCSTGFLQHAPMMVSLSSQGTLFCRYKQCHLIALLANDSDLRDRLYITAEGVMQAALIPGLLKSQLVPTTYSLP